jgi:hypothetical protein
MIIESHSMKKRKFVQKVTTLFFVNLMIFSVLSLRFTHVLASSVTLAQLTQQNAFYHSIAIVFNEGHATLNGQAYTSGTVIEMDGHYQLDHQLNAQTNSYPFTIDSTPIIVTDITFSKAELEWGEEQRVFISFIDLSPQNSYAAISFQNIQSKFVYEHLIDVNLYYSESSNMLEASFVIPHGYDPGLYTLTDNFFRDGLGNSGTDVSAFHTYGFRVKASSPAVKDQDSDIGKPPKDETKSENPQSDASLLPQDFEGLMSWLENHTQSFPKDHVQDVRIVLSRLLSLDEHFERHFSTDLWMNIDELLKRIYPDQIHQKLLSTIPSFKIMGIHRLSMKELIDNQSLSYFIQVQTDLDLNEQQTVQAYLDQSLNLDQLYGFRIMIKRSNNNVMELMTNYQYPLMVSMPLPESLRDQEDLVLLSMRSNQIGEINFSIEDNALHFEIVENAVYVVINRELLLTSQDSHRNSKMSLNHPMVWGFVMGLVLSVGFVMIKKRIS